MVSTALWQELHQAVLAGERVALATVVSMEGSTPRPAGASLLLRADGAVVGAVSGGCVEGDLLEAASIVIAGGSPQRRRYAGIDGDDPFSIGLTCGGSLEVVIEALGPAAGGQCQGRDGISDPAVLSALANAIGQDRPALLASRLDGQGGLRLLTARQAVGSLGSNHLDATADAIWERQRMAPAAIATPGLSAEWPALAWVEPREAPASDTLVLRLHLPRPPLWILGAIDGAAALAQMARQLGFRVTVVDARAAFATATRFPMADAVVCAWPDSWMLEQEISPETVIAVLTHDPRFDIPALTLALRSPAAYIGAMGSRRTNADRLARLRLAGLSEKEISRLRAPIGLDLGGRSAEAMALSILAEVVMLRQGGTGQPLCHGNGPIHHH